MYQLGFFSSTDDQLKVIFTLLKNRLRPIITHEEYAYSKGNKKVFVPVVMCKDVDIDETIGDIKVFTKDDIIFIENDVLKYQFPKKYLGLILSRMQKALQFKV